MPQWGVVMQIKNFRMREIRKLKELNIESGVLNTEALMLVLKRKSFPDKVVRVFKYLDAQEDPDVMAKKVYVVTTLNTNNPYKEIEELIIPDSIIYVDNLIAGFGVPLIKNHKNFGAIIQNPNISLKDKIPYLQQLGSLIDKVQRVEVSKNRFQFGDLNEFNFIIDENDVVKAIDLDSAYLGVGEPLDMAYYLLRNDYITTFIKQHNSNKYKVTDNGIIIPNDDTDLYCYNMIILKALSRENIYKQDINTYYQYLEYLRLLGLPNDLIESFNNIYIPKENSNPKDILDQVDPSLEEKLDFKEFIKTFKN